MKLESLDRRLTFGMFVKGIGEKLKGIMAKSITPEEKLRLIQEEMEKDVQDKRSTARNIRVKMTALSDPDTAEMEPIERLKIRREKLVNLGKKALAEKGEPEAVKVAKEIKALDASLSSLESTYETLKDAYAVALESYKTANAALEHVKINGQSILFAIKAHKDALETKDQSRTGKKVDASFLDDLSAELENSQRELKADGDLATEEEKEKSILDEEESGEVDQKIMDEFK